MLVNAEHARDLQRHEFTVFKVVHVIVIARNRAVRFIETPAQALTRDTLRVLAVNLLLQGFSRAALIRLNAVKIAGGNIWPQPRQ